MICASCARPALAEDVCAACGASPLLDGRWRLESEIGHGAAGTVFRASEVGTGRVVAAKEVSLPRHAARAAAVVCAREAAILRQLEHPGIPRLVDARVDGATLWVFQELVEGESLERAMEHHRYTEDEVLAILEELLGILVYLHGLSPPVIHRDVKPANVIVRDDGRLALVDFGSVRDQVADGTASTAAGTFGYMAPEQLRGEAGPGSDIYAVGAVAVALLSRRSPATLLGWDQRLDWRPHVRVRAATSELLGDLLTLDPRRRPSDAARVLARVRAARAGERPVRWGAVGVGAAGIALFVGVMFGRGTAGAPGEPTPAVALSPPITPSPELAASGERPSSGGPLPATLDADGATGTLHTVFDEAGAIACAYRTINSVYSAEQSYDAAFDEFTDDFAQLGWGPDAECRWYVTASVQWLDYPNFRLHAVLTRGTGRGRQLTREYRGGVREGTRLTEAEVEKVIEAGSRWPEAVED